MSDLTQTRTLSPRDICTVSKPRPSLWSYLGLMRQRRALARLDDTRLADLGLSRDEAQNEADRPIWDVPSHWCE